MRPPATSSETLSSLPGASRRTAILHAALECFSTLGYARTTMEDIRMRAQASTGSLYHHFKSKEHLAAELFVAGLRSYRKRLARELAHHADLRQGIRGVIEEHLRQSTDEPLWARYMHGRLAEISSDSENLDARRDTALGISRDLAEWLEPFVAAGEVRRLTPALYSALIYGAVRDVQRAQLVEDIDTSDMELVSLLAETAWNAVRRA
jgi:AcrR family transcriptional regulator